MAAIAVGIAGAFTTASLHAQNRAAAPESGYVLDSQGRCNIEVECDDNPNPVCRLNGDSGPQAFAKDADGNCNQITYKPQN